MIPGSTGIVVNIPPVKSAYASKMPNWQFRIGLSGRSQCCTFVYEPFQQCVYGNALPPGFISKTCFDLSRNFDTHAALLLSLCPSDKSGHYNTMKLIF
jgi:hypothetical protein